jgi:hypothetical protein
VTDRVLPQLRHLRALTALDITDCKLVEVCCCPLCSSLLSLCDAASFIVWFAHPWHF